MSFTVRKRSIRFRVLALSSLVCLVLVANVAFFTATLSSLRTGSATSHLAAMQVARSLRINLLLNQTVAGADLRDKYDREVFLFEEAQSALINGGSIPSGLNESIQIEAISAEAQEEALVTVASIWSSYHAQTEEAYALNASRLVALSVSTRELAPIQAGLASLGRRYSQADEDEYEYHIETVEDLRAIVEKVRNGLFMLAAVSDDEELQQTKLALELWVDSLTGQVEALIAGSDELELEPTEDAQALSLLAELKSTTDGFQGSVKLFAESEFALDVLMAELDKSMNRLVVAQNEFSDLTAASSARMLGRFQTMQTAMLLVALISTLAVGVVLIRSVIRPIKKVSGLMKEIAHGGGDLTARLSINTQDEIGDLAKWVDSFIGNTQDVIRHVSKTANAVRVSAANVDSVSSAMNTAAVETAQQARALSTGIGGMNQMLRSTQNQVVSSSQEVAKRVGSAVEVASRASLGLDSLVKSCFEIRSVLEEIGGIAARTRMLSLNASVEAARAGVAGAGFAVVAEEVKSLADETENQTTRVSEVLSRVSLDSEGAQALIGEVGDVIAIAMDHQALSTKEIVGTLGDFAAEAEQIQEAVNSLAGQVVTTSKRSETTMGHASSLTQISTQLSSLISRFQY